MQARSETPLRLEFVMQAGEGSNGANMIGGKQEL
jgi:hypothetical protein